MPCIRTLGGHVPVRALAMTVPLACNRRMAPLSPGDSAIALLAAIRPSWEEGRATAPGSARAFFPAIASQFSSGRGQAESRPNPGQILAESSPILTKSRQSWPRPDYNTRTQCTKTANGPRCSRRAAPSPNPSQCPGCGLDYGMQRPSRRDASRGNAGLRPSPAATARSC
jgi:hypothetical protein